MQMKLSKFLTIVFGILALISIIVYVFLGSRMNQTNDRAEEEKSLYESTKSDIEEMRAKSKRNRVVISKAENNHENVSETALNTVDGFLKQVKKANVGTDEERAENYQKSLKSYASSDVLSNEDILHLKVPDNYKLYPGTSKSGSIQVLMAFDNKDKNDTYTKYGEFMVDTVNKQVTSYVEYDILSQEDENNE